jgi:hypothetical protein
MSYRDNYAFANKYSEERSAPRIVLGDKYSQAETSSDGGDSNADTSSDGEYSAVGICSDEDDSNAKRSHHEDFDASTDSSSDGEYEKVSSRSLPELL